MVHYAQNNSPISDKPRVRYRSSIIRQYTVECRVLFSTQHQTDAIALQLRIEQCTSFEILATNVREISIEFFTSRVDIGPLR